MLEIIRYYQKEKPLISFSEFNKSSIEKRNNYNTSLSINPTEKRVEIIAYCIMPTHLHFILKQLKTNGISTFINNIFNSYTRYFNLKHKRKGPLWEGRFKEILVKNDEYLLHLTRYLHLNPVTAYIVNNPHEWSKSSYSEYLNPNQTLVKICKFDDVLSIKPDAYKEFVEDSIQYQRDLSKIKSLILE